MDEVGYDSFVETIFKSPHLDRAIQQQIIGDLSDKDPGLRSTIEKNAKHILYKANWHGYNVITRFVPPYCSTVTFYTEKIGFVTVSRLSPNFDSSLERVADDLEVTRGAINTLEAAYRDALLLNIARHGAGIAGAMSHPRDKTAHQNALHGSALEYNQVYTRVECPASTNPGPVLTFNPTSQACGVHQWVERKLRIIFHRLFGGSKVDFRKGPAAVLNDFVYKTHEGKYAKNVHIIGGELSAHLSTVGRIFAMLNLNASIVGIAAVIALFTSASGDNKAAKITSASLLLGLFAWQGLWTLFMTTTTYENMVSNDLRLRTENAAVSLFGLDHWHLALFLAMISPQEDIYAHGTYHSWLDLAGFGILEMTGPAPPELLYLAGYITTSLDPSEIDNTTDSCAALAAWVPYDTHRITYASNDKVRKFTLIDNFLHLSYSSRSSLGENGGALVFKHDGDELNLPRKLRIYIKEIG